MSSTIYMHILDFPGGEIQYILIFPGGKRENGKKMMERKER
jgi:hypothetical protein